MGYTLTEDIGDTEMGNHALERRVTYGTERKICGPRARELLTHVKNNIGYFDLC
jgi:hypothetical protein